MQDTQKQRQNATQHIFVRSCAIVVAIVGIMQIVRIKGPEQLHPAALENPSASWSLATVEQIEPSVTRTQVLQKTLHVVVSDPSKNHSDIAKWTIDLEERPQLIASADVWLAKGFAINTNLLADQIQQQEYLQDSVVDVDVLAVQQQKKVYFASVSALGRSGFVYEAESAAMQITDAFERGVDSLDMIAPFRSPFVYVTDDQGNRVTLSLLATGVSDFSGSPSARIWNMHKAIDEHIHNLFIPAGSTFSFVDAIDPPITLSKGWKEGLGLFGGGTAFTPGAGICQVATTVYRAALLAGLPIIERQEHSMWVQHYEPYGVGLDATVFPGSHDLRFRNDTDQPMLVQAYTEGDEMYVNIYGKKDDRSVMLDGPYFFNTPHRPKPLRALAVNEIGWIRNVQSASGVREVEPIVSTYYLGYPRSIREKYADAPGEKLLQKSNRVFSQEPSHISLTQ